MLNGFLHQINVSKWNQFPTLNFDTNNLCPIYEMSNFRIDCNCVNFLNQPYKKYLVYIKSKSYNHFSVNYNHICCVFWPAPKSWSKYTTHICSIRLTKCTTSRINRGPILLIFLVLMAVWQNVHLHLQEKLILYIFYSVVFYNCDKIFHLLEHVLCFWSGSQFCLEMIKLVKNLIVVSN